MSCFSEKLIPKIFVNNSSIESKSEIEKSLIKSNGVQTFSITFLIKDLFITEIFKHPICTSRCKLAKTAHAFLLQRVKRATNFCMYFRLNKINNFNFIFYFKPLLINNGSTDGCLPRNFTY